MTVQESPDQALVGAAAGGADAQAARLLSAIARGEIDSMAAMYDLTAPRVYGLVLRVVNDVDEAVDITRWTYREVRKRAGEYDPGLGSALSWVLMLAHGCAVARVRSFAVAPAAHRGQVEQLPLAAAPALTGQHRVLVALAYFECRSQSEIAEQLGISVATVRTRLHRAMQQLRQNFVLPA